MAARTFARDGAPYAIGFQDGRAKLADGSGGQTGGLIRTTFGVGTRQWHDRTFKVTPWPEGISHGWAARREDVAPLDAWVRRVMRRLEAELGITGWVYDCGLYGFTDGRPIKRPVLSMCAGHSDSNGGYCGRPIFDERPLCGIHSGAAARREAQREVERQRAEARRERIDRNLQQTAELREVWDRVLEQREVIQRAAGDRPTVSAGTAYVDLEVLMMLLRELDWEGRQ